MDATVVGAFLSFLRVGGGAVSMEGFGRGLRMPNLYEWIAFTQTLPVTGRQWPAAP